MKVGIIWLFEYIDRLAYQRRFYSPFYSRRRDPYALLYGRIQTNPLIVTEVVENRSILPMSKKDFKESNRKYM